MIPSAEHPKVQSECWERDITQSNKARSISCSWLARKADSQNISEHIDISIELNLFLYFK